MYFLRFVFGFIFCGLLFRTELLAQPIGKHQMSAHPFAGYFLRFSERIAHIESIPVGMEIAYDRLSEGDKEWEHFFGFPERGVTLTYVNYQNDILGYTLSLIPHVEFFPASTNRSKTGVRIGFGGAYHSRPFHEQNNPLNVAIGTHFNYTMQLRFAHHMFLSEQSSIVSSLGFTHFSNGAYRMPNMGINYPFLSIGYTQLLDGKRPNPEKGKFEERFESPFNLWTVQVLFMAGLKGIYPAEEYGFPFFTSSLTLFRQMSRISSLQMGLELYNDTSVKRHIDRNPNFDESTDFRRIGLVVGHELLIDKIGVTTQVGMYLYRPYPSDRMVYKRLGLKYYYNKNLFSSLSLKTHLGRANALEYGIGLRF